MNLAIRLALSMVNGYRLRLIILVGLEFAAAITPFDAPKIAMIATIFAYNVQEFIRFPFLVPGEIQHVEKDDIHTHAIGHTLRGLLRRPSHELRDWLFTIAHTLRFTFPVLTRGPLITMPHYTPTIRIRATIKAQFMGERSYLSSPVRGRRLGQH